MSSDNQSSRRLAAILFADVAGYTSIMQRDERAASTLLRRFQEQIELKVPGHKGKIINFYGDGVFCVFQNPLDAMHCAMELQEEFQNDPKVPVRVGLHSGTVVFEGGRAYGNNVNIASRIESMGVPGAILVSKKVRDELKNQPDILLPSLGKFEFKNVEEPMEVFALAKEGFAVPKKGEIQGKFKDSTPIKKTRWLVPAVLAVLILSALGYWQLNSASPIFDSLLSADIRNKRVSVMVFENQTMDPSMDAFGTMVSDWITRGLMETGQANVISGANIQSQIQLAGMGPASMKQVAANTGVGVFLQGRYYLQKDQLIIHANLVDAAQGEVLYALDPIQGPRDQMLQLLEQLTQNILGYWAIEKQTRFLQNPPKYEAFQEWLKGEELFYVDPKQSEVHLINAIEYDSTFYMAILKLVPLYTNSGDFDKRNDVLAYLKTLQSNFTQWELLRYKTFYAFSECNILESAGFAEERFHMDESDITGNINAGHNYNLANYPQKALDVLNRFDLRLRDMTTNASNREMWLSLAYFKLGEYDKAISVIESYPFESVNIGQAIIHMGALVHSGQFDALETTLNKYNSRKVYGLGSRHVERQLLYFTCNHLMTVHQDSLSKIYAQQLLNWCERNPDEPNYKSLGFAYYYQSDYQKAIDAWKKIPDVFNTALIQTYMGICYAKLNDSLEASNYIQLISSMDIEEQDKYYNISTIQTVLGNHKEAISALTQSMEICERHGQGRYQYDHTFRDLFENAAFQELVKPKGLGK